MYHFGKGSQSVHLLYYDRNELFVVKKVESKLNLQLNGKLNVPSKPVIAVASVASNPSITTTTRTHINKWRLTCNTPQTDSLMKIQPKVCYRSLRWEQRSSRHKNHRASSIHTALIQNTYKGPILNSIRGQYGDSIFGLYCTCTRSEIHVWSGIIL